MTTLIIFLVVIIVLVVAHELGHFFLAKLFGVRVDEFGIGYPPRAKKLFHWKGTLFSLNWLPFGGFVKIFGEEIEGAEKGSESSGSFAYQKLWKRLLILVGGILANIILAIVLYTLSFSIGFIGSPEEFQNIKILAQPKVMITEVLPGSPSFIAGVKINDEIDSLSIGKNEPFVPKKNSDVINFIQNNSNENISVSVSRGNEHKVFSIKPVANIANGKYGIGVGIEATALMRMSFFKAIFYGTQYTFYQLQMIVASLFGLLSSLFAGNGSIASQLSGPIGIAKFAGFAYSMGIGSFFAFMAMISLNLAVVNLFPFPALDGGRMVLELFSKNGKNRIPAKIVSGINQIGFLLLIVLMLWVTYHDIFHPVL